MISVRIITNGPQLLKSKVRIISLSPPETPLCAGGQHPQRLDGTDHFMRGRLDVER
jgi:hypothetical protein